MPCALTQGYNLDCMENVGGVKTVYVMEFENATTITNTAGLITTLTKATGKKFWKYNLEKETAEASEQMTVNRENNTKFVKQTVKFVFNKQSVSLRDEITLLASNRCLVVTLTNNGEYWLYGKDFGLNIATVDVKTGVKLGDRNGYELTLESDEKTFAYKLNDAIAAALETAGT